MNITIIGGSGFVGTRLAAVFRNGGFDIFPKMRHYQIRSER
jgi:nucleoside-diphosphate-sugar epimerase